MSTSHKDFTTDASSSAPTGADAAPLSPNHLDHPERWATGGDRATGKQIGFISVLEKQKGLKVGEERKAEMGKSEASEVIDGLKNGKVIPEESIDAPGVPKRKRENAEDQDGETKTDDVGASNEDDQPSESTEPTKENVKKEGSTKKTDEKEGEENSTSTDVKKSTETPDKSTEDDGEKKEDTSSNPPPSKKTKTSDDVPKDPSAASNGDSKKEIPNLPDAEAPQDDHLNHPETWATGDDPATEKQIGYLNILEKKNGDGATKDHSGMGKSEASERIEELK